MWVTGSVIHTKIRFWLEYLIKLIQVIIHFMLKQFCQKCIQGEKQKVFFHEIMTITPQLCVALVADVQIQTLIFFD
jgi:hypothetical protein